MESHSIFCQKANKPLALFTKLAGDSIKINIVNETLSPYKFQGFDIVWKTFSGKEVSRQKIQISEGIVPDNRVWNLTFALKKEKWTPSDSASLYIEIKPITKSDQPSIADFLFYKLPKGLNLIEAELKTEIAKTETGYQLKINAKNLVKNLYISSKNSSVYFSDNYFDILPGEEKIVDFKSDIELSPDDLNFKMLLNQQ